MTKNRILSVDAEDLAPSVRMASEKSMTRNGPTLLLRGITYLLNLPRPSYRCRVHQ